VSVDVSIPAAIQRGPGCPIRTLLMRFRLWLFWRMQKDLFSSLQKWWDAGKQKINGLAVCFSSYKKKASLEARSLLLNLVSHPKGNIESSVVSCHYVYALTLASLAK